MITKENTLEDIARRRKITPLQTYVFTHKEGQEEVVLEVDRSGNGWVSLGKYDFPRGVAKMTLLEKGAYPEQEIYADAVKWVRVK